jgi:hypothetical protein
MWGPTVRKKRKEERKGKGKVARSGWAGPLLPTAGPRGRAHSARGGRTVAGWAGFGPVRSAAVSLFFPNYFSFLLFWLLAFQLANKNTEKIVKIPVAQ